MPAPCSCRQRMFRSGLPISTLTFQHYIQPRLGMPASSLTRQRQAPRPGDHPSHTSPPPNPRPIRWAAKEMLCTMLPTRAFTESKDAWGGEICLLTSMSWTMDIQSGFGSVKFQAMLMWKYSEWSVCSSVRASRFTLFADGGEVSCIGPSPLPPV